MIEELLSVGPEGGLHLGELSSLVHTDRRSVRAMVQRERLAGALIVSDAEHGYYMADDPSEVHRFCRQMRGRARAILKVAAAVERAGRREFGEGGDD